jgi:hypothetical protein
MTTKQGHGLTEKQMKAVRKAFGEMQPGNVELKSIDVVYCYQSDKFVPRGECHSCGGLDADYSDSWHVVKCNCTGRGSFVYSGKTLDQMIKMLTNERDRIRKELETHKEDDVCNCKECLKRRHENWMKIRKESEQLSKELSRVSFEDMHRPFTI